VSFKETFTVLYITTRHVIFLQCLDPTGWVTKTAIGL